MRKFKKGDKVRALNSTWGQFTAGIIYTVREDQTTAMVLVERDDRGSLTNGWNQHNFELVPVATYTFKIGDAVRVTKSGSVHKGMVGVITSLPDYGRNDWFYRVKIDDVGYRCYIAKHLEAYTLAKALPDPRLAVLDKADLKTVSAVEKVIADAKPKPAPEKRTAIVDSKNPARVLGTIPEQRPQGAFFEVAVMEPMRPLAYSYAPADMMKSVTCKRVTFRVERITNDGGWTYTPVLVTDACLGDLIRIRDFRLPGETKAQAEDRQYGF